MIYGSVCSGIEAASVAWEPLGWKPAFFSEIDKFPSAVLAHHWPDVPNLGDFTTIDAERYPIELLVGGTPCQAFSVAGARRSLADARGNLTLSFVNLVHASRHLRWVVWENVPGILSTKDNAFGCFLGGLVGSDDPLAAPRGKRWPDAGMAAGPLGRAAWRILDAQYFGVPQRRRRVFVVFCPRGSGGDPAAVLFERKGLHGDSPPRREAGQGAAHDLAPSLTASGRGVERPGDPRGQDPVAAVPRAFGGGNTSGDLDVAACLTAKGCRQDFEVETFVAEPVAFDIKGGLAPNGSTPISSVAHPLKATDHKDPQVVAFALRGREDGAVPEISGEATGALRAASGGSGRDYVATAFPIDANALRGDSRALTPSPDAEGRIRLRDPGLGIGGDGDPAPTLQTGAPPAVATAFAIQERAVCENPNAGPDGIGVKEGVAYTLEARQVTQAVATVFSHAFDARQQDVIQYSKPKAGDPCHPLASGAHPPAVAFQSSQSGVRVDDVHATLDSNNGSRRHNGTITGSSVRRLTPRECERLQGFPDDYTLIPWRKGMAADGPRYKALGNSMAVPVMAWIGERIDAYEKGTL